MDLALHTDKRAYRYVIGIDLGTTNSVVAYVDLKKRRRKGKRSVDVFEVPQLIAPGEMGLQSTLPSFLYLPGVHDLPEGSTALPWDAERRYVVGTLARERGAEVPGRLVASAKSWLSHRSVDRTASILPWQAPGDVKQVSPVVASQRYLQHLREAWNEHKAAEDDTLRFEEQLIVLTVPASFDEVARELTVQAAKDAGLSRIVLLEEPLAAFYAWLDAHPVERDTMQDGQLILVCDVGGGTSDFSIIGVREEREERRFERLAVGEHLMLGGDNMDVTLGRQLELELVGAPGALDVRRWHQLVHRCRVAKEKLLGVDAPEEWPVVVAGAGSALVGGSLKSTLRRATVEERILDGFFPKVPLTGASKPKKRAGLTEFGLPYEQEPAITHHLAAFWQRFQPIVQAETGRALPIPDYVLFNGGVFTPERLRQRVLDVIQHWFPEAGSDWQPIALSSPRLDLAVAKGAAYYGLARRGEGTRVGSGSARAYYVGVKAEEHAKNEETVPSVCIVPRGAEEGFAAHLDQTPFEALTNQPVTFHLFTSTTRTGDAFGEIVSLDTASIQPLPPVRTVLRFGRKGIARSLPVELAVRLNEIGTLEIWCESVQTEHRWQLAFDVRQEGEHEEDVEAEQSSAELPDLARIKTAQQVIQDKFAGKASPESVWGYLEEVLGAPREEWVLPVARKLADSLLDTPRSASREHEVVWFDLLGYCLRPGYGDDVDNWRLQEVWKRYMEGVIFVNKSANRHAWWHFWRRVGAGLPPEKQAQMYYDARPYIQLRVKTNKKHRLYSRRMDAKEKLEAWKTLASFERLSSDIKTALGQLLVQQIKQGRSGSGEWWALARLGTRLPINGLLENLVPAPEVTAWLDTLLKTHLPRRRFVAYTLINLTRPSGDRSRDVATDTRDRVYRWLRKLEDTADYRALLDLGNDAPELEQWLQGEVPPPAGKTLNEPHGIVVAREDE